VRELFFTHINVKGLARFLHELIAKHKHAFTVDGSESCVIEVIGLKGGYFKGLKVEEVVCFFVSASSVFAFKFERVAEERTRSFLV